MAENLLPCPFCGEEEPLMRERYINGSANVRAYRRECRYCKATFANWYRSMKKADEAWNRRADHIRDATKKVSNADRIRGMSIGEAMNCPKCNSANIYTPAENLFICNRCGHEWQAEVEGRAVVLPCKVEPFDCQHCKHLSPSDKTNRLFCSYHGEGEHQYEVYLDDYCSNFERAEAEAKGERE